MCVLLCVRCTSCLSTRWRCYWDQDSHSCLSTKDDSKPSLLENSACCPSLVAKDVPPSPSGITQDFTLSLSNVEQGEELECDFGSEQRYEARWLDSGSEVKCSGVMLTTAERSQVFQLNLRRKGHLDKYTDSPKPMTVEVYNCGVGSGDCSQCWGREDQGHLCGWCDNSCRPRDDCQYITSQCPDPEITKVGINTHTHNALI
ncbi:unnamed protein product [Coregonus sp. 'balchen']|nr:unnamed protein product [Coregonus sp. 'balchen']